MSRLFVFGLGYTARRLAARLEAEGWRVDGTGSQGSIPFDDAHAAIGMATHVLSSVPPAADADPVLARYDATLKAAPARWIGYLSSTGVYGDAGGAWVDESAPLGGRRGGRVAADQAWQALGATVLRLPGIYGPGRSMLERAAAGQAHRIDLPGQVFSRVHVDDIVSGVIASFGAPTGVYNLADDHPCSQNEVVGYACALLRRAPPPLQSLDDAGLSAAARAFYAENRRVANAKAKRVLGWRPVYPDYRAGLRSLSSAAGGCITRGDGDVPRARSAMTSPSSDSAAPTAAHQDQR